MEVKLRWVVLLADTSQLGMKVYMDIRFVGRWRLDLVINRRVEGQCFIDDFDNLKLH